jgi:hypothetical protein
VDLNRDEQVKVSAPDAYVDVARPFVIYQQTVQEATIIERNSLDVDYVAWKGDLMFIVILFVLVMMWYAVFSLGAVASEGQAHSKESKVYSIGSRLELFVDDWLIERMGGVELRLHHPTPREVAIVFDKPWEGSTSAYVTVFQDGDLFRMYYRGSNYDAEKRQATHQVTCYAESEDGIHWKKPELNLFDFEGSTRNNIVWIGEGNHNFAPFKDTSPAADHTAQYKALASRGSEGLLAFQSPDGIHWELMQKEPVITKGAFDSQNLAFWNPLTNCYMDFHRGFYSGVRHIMTCTSQDFTHWTEPQWLDFGDAPLEHLYTNAVKPYYRAPHILLGFPKRFVPSRKKLSDDPHTGVSDGVFMSSRDGLHWHRWLEAFIRPGLQRERWWQRNNMTAWGILVTKSDVPGMPDELSFYSSESYYSPGNRLRRYTLRMDGFVSVRAPYAGGEFTTRPLVFEGKNLVINYSTSAAGSVRAEVTDRNGDPISGFALDDCSEIYGDEIEKPVEWESGSDLGQLAGQVVRLRFVLKDADLYAIRFRP